MHRTAEGLGLLMSFGTQVIPSPAPDTGHRAFRFDVFPAGFQSGSDAIILCYAPFFSFGMGLFILYYCALEVCNLFMTL